VNGSQIINTHHNDDEEGEKAWKRSIQTSKGSQMSHEGIGSAQSVEGGGWRSSTNIDGETAD
jgi:hypothetical protein